MADDEPVGICTFIIDPMDDWVALIGVIIAETYARNRGVGTRAHALYVDRIFETNPAVHKVEGITDCMNFAERRALEKAGFLFEGELRARNRLSGVLRDMAYYGILRTEWQARRK